MEKIKKSIELLQEFEVWYDGYVPNSSNRQHYISVDDYGNCRESIGKKGNPMDILYTDNRVKAARAFNKYAEYLVAVLEEAEVSKSEYFEAFRLLHAMKHGRKADWVADIQMPFDLESGDYKFSDSMKYEESKGFFVFTRKGRKASFLEALQLLNEECSPYGERYLENKTRFFLQDIKDAVCLRVEAFKKADHSLEEQAKFFWLIKEARRAPWCILAEETLKEIEKSLLED